MSMGQRSRLALTLPGGGARGAYQAGVLARLGETLEGLDVGIITGVSAGAINAAFLANHPGNFRQATFDMATLWARLSTDAVVRGAPLQMAGNVARWSAQLLSGGLLPNARGLLDTAPLRALLERVLTDEAGELSGVQQKLANGRLSAFAVTTTSYATGEAITFAQLPPEHAVVAWQRPYRIGCSAIIRVDHVMASAAIPLLFPAVRIDGSWHGDGSVRQVAPLSPALKLGAERIILISTVRGPTPRATPQLTVDAYPSLARITGVALNSLLNGHDDYDATQLRRITELLRTCPDQSSSELKPVDLFVIRPSEDLGKIAAEYEDQLPRALRYLTRGLGTREANSTDLLSTLLFDAAYTQRLIECGRQDAERQIDELITFLAETESD
jgi:NTE family protein